MSVTSLASLRSMPEQFATFISREVTSFGSLLADHLDVRGGRSRARGVAAQTAAATAPPAPAAARDKGKEKARVVFSDELDSYFEARSEADAVGAAKDSQSIVATRGSSEAGAFTSTSSAMRHAAGPGSPRSKAAAEPHGSAFDARRFIERNVCAASHPGKAWCEGLVHFAQSINQHPTLRGRFERADALWQVAGALDRHSAVRQQVADALGQICIVQDKEVLEFEALVEDFLEPPPASSSEEASQLSKARASALLTLSLEIVRLPLAARERMARKFLALLPTFSDQERDSLRNIFMLLLPALPPQDRLPLLQFMLAKALENASPAAAEGFLQRTAQQIGKIGLERVAAAVRVLFEAADAFALPDDGKAELLGLAMRSNARLLPVWLAGNPWVHRLDGTAFEALLDALEHLDDADRELAVPFLAAHLAPCKWHDGDHRAHLLVHLIYYVSSLSSPIDSQATLRSVVKGIYARSQPPGELAGEIRLLLEAFDDIAQPEVLLALLKEISAHLPLEALQIPNAPLVEALAQRYQLLTRRVLEQAQRKAGQQVGEQMAALTTGK